MATARIIAGQRKSTEFEDFSDTVVHADARVAGGKARALLVFRQRDSGIWYALGDVRRTQLVRVTMRCLLDSDRTLAGLGEMPNGKGVQRARGTLAWETCPAPPSSEQEQLPYLVETLRLRMARWADIAAALLIFPGIACGLGAGYLGMMDSGAASEVSRTWMIPLAVVGAWLFLAGVVAGATRRAVWVLVGAMGMTAAAAVPFLIPAFDLGRWRPALGVPAAYALLLFWRAGRMGWAARSLRRWQRLEPTSGGTDEDAPTSAVPTRAPR
ncbi:MAG: hypothetical protein H0V44_01555 [Planctomycetes bacterium]|nr:hypothetical protein [Planctomycetota bacterium]